MVFGLISSLGSFIIVLVQARVCHAHKRSQQCNYGQRRGLTKIVNGVVVA